VLSTHAIHRSETSFGGAIRRSQMVDPVACVRQGSRFPPAEGVADHGNTVVSLHVTLIGRSLEVSGPLSMTKRPLMVLVALLTAALPVEILLREDGRSSRDHRIEFDAQVGRLKFTQPFDADDMMFHGKLEL
jgi:hypothetical protein